MVRIDCPTLTRPAFRLLRSTLAALVWCSAWLHATPVDAAPPAGWWRDATFYEIFVRSFADAQSGPLAGDGIGDLQGLIEHLDYLNDGRNGEGSALGITAVWLMPIQPSPSYHGYDVTDYFAVNPQYGDVALMKTFVAEAHRRGIRVIIDLVLNHASSQHPWFKEAAAGGSGGAKARALFRFADVPENVSGPWGDRTWHPVNDEFYYGVFSSEMPDWNFRTTAVTDHHRKCAEFWLREVGVDGFRLDAVRYLYETGDALQDTEETRQWLHDFTAYCHAVKPGAFIVGENTADMREVSRYLRGGSLDSSFEFELARATVESIKLRAPRLLMQTQQRLARIYAGESPWSTFLSNHDQDRIFSQLGGDASDARLAAKLLFTQPGVPFVYYGEELGMTGRKPDPELRTPMPWAAQPPNAGFTRSETKPWHAVTGDIGRVNVQAETAAPDSLLALYRRLIRLNLGSPALRHGEALEVSGGDRHVYVALRQTADEAVLVLANFDPQPRPGPVLSLTRSNIRRAWTVSEILANAPVEAVSVNEDGGFSNAMPIAELAAKSVYVVRWTRR